MYFLSYETQKLVFSISIGILNLLACYFRIVNSSLFGKIIYADYFLNGFHENECVRSYSFFFLVRVLEHAWYPSITRIVPSLHR